MCNKRLGVLIFNYFVAILTNRSLVSSWRILKPNPQFLGTITLPGQGLACARHVSCVLDISKYICAA